MQKQNASKKGTSSFNERGKGVAAINMKDFKCQIDHEIAKCLDTLDRQGLKFLRETLRASKIFGLNTQELGLTQPVEESHSDEDSPKTTKEEQPKVVKEVPKKTETKSTAQIKKAVVKPQPPKKAVAASGKTSKGNLGDNITKRLEGLNIKTGKKNDNKNIKKEKVVEKVEAEIAEQIEIEDADPPPEITPKQQPTINYNSVPISVLSQSGKSWKKEEFGESPVKPFCKKQFKKEGKHKQHKDYGIEISKPEQFKREISDKSQHSVQVQQQVLPIEEELNEAIKTEDKPVFQQKQQTKNDIVQAKQLPLASPKAQKKEEQPKDQGLQNLINIIGRLSPSKRIRIQRIIEKMQNSDKFDNTSSLLSNAPKIEPSYHRPYIALSKNSEVRENHSKSRSKLQKVEKATSLKSSVVRRMPGSQLTPQNRGNMTPLHKKTEPNVLEMYEDAKSQLISQNRKEPPSLPAADTPNEQVKVQILQNNKEQDKLDSLNADSKQMHSSVNLSASYHSQLTANNQSGQKLIKISKKKNKLTSLTFKVLSNHGHSSLVGLTAIHLFNPQAQLITVDETNIRNSNPKLLKLFNDNLRGEGWLTSLPTATIYLENISQTVAGIRIVNWNRSELEADRQADLVQVWINDQLHWRGQVKGGSFKQSEVYATNIKVTQKHFDFPPIQTQSIVSQSSVDLLVKNQSVKNVQLKVEKERQVCWLEKETVEKQLKQFEEDERRQQKIKKIGTVRNTVVTKNAQGRRDIIEQKPFEFNWLNQAKQKKEIQVKPIFKQQQNDDILGELSRGLQIKRLKEESSVSIKKKDEAFPKVKQTLKIREQSGSKKHQQYLLQKEKEQDEQFEKILQSMQQRSKPQDIQTKPKIVPKEVVENKGRAVAQKNFQDFMKDSLFDQKPRRKLQSKGRQITEQRKPQVQAASKKNINTQQLDELIGELNNVVGQGEETGEQFIIPQLPIGKEVSLVLISNWGNQSFIGLNGIEFFDVEGESVRPIGLSCSFMSGKELFQKLLKQELLTSDQKMQVRFPKGKRVGISLTLPQKTQLAAIRIWNYNGHRVHNNIGVKKLHVKLDGNFIFSGEIQQSLGSSQDAYKYCEYILFTENPQILNKISDNDWLTRITLREQEQRAMFRTTLQHFHRPVTRNDEQTLRQEVAIDKQPIKLPKRNCAEYDPPLLPQGFVLKLVLHSSWGDRFFIGLNGVEVFNEKGQNITTKNLSQIRAEPSSVSKLEGYERDKRVIGNLINGKNNSTADCNIWLAPLLSDVEKIEKGRPNVILLQYSKPTRISGINFYNYVKTPSRGVREIEVFLDSFLLYRGYLRQNDATCIHTTINFTKEQALLEAMNFSAYNQDHLQQEVGLVNEQKILRTSSAVHFQPNLVRPMTGKLS